MVFCTRHPHHAMNSFLDSGQMRWPNQGPSIGDEGGRRTGWAFFLTMPAAIGSSIADRCLRGSFSSPCLPSSSSAWYFHAYTRAPIAGHVIVTRAGRAAMEPNERATSEREGRGGQPDDPWSF